MSSGLRQFLLKSSRGGWNKTKRRCNGIGGQVKSQKTNVRSMECAGRRAGEGDEKKGEKNKTGNQLPGIPTSFHTSPEKTRRVGLNKHQKNGKKAVKSITEQTTEENIANLGLGKKTSTTQLRGREVCIKRGGG